jgi:hypothetical protein
MFLLSIVSITFLLILFFYSFDTSSKISIPINSHQLDMMKPFLTESNLLQNDTRMYIFSKYEYLNITRKVKLFGFYDCIFYYCITISAK